MYPPKYLKSLAISIFLISSSNTKKYLYISIIVFNISLGILRVFKLCIKFIKFVVSIKKTTAKRESEDFKIIEMKIKKFLVIREVIEKNIINGINVVNFLINFLREILYVEIRIKIVIKCKKSLSKFKLFVVIMEIINETINKIFIKGFLINLFSLKEFLKNITE